MTVWSVPKLGIEFLEYLEPVLNSPRTVWVVCVIIYAINYGLGVVGPEMAMDFGSTRWNRCLVRGLPTHNPLLVLGTIKNSLGLLVGSRMVHVCCK